MDPVYRPFVGRRPSREVRIGTTAIGGKNPIRVQSMLTSDTMDTDACVAETLGLVAVGCEIVRITAPTVKDARNLEAIRQALEAAGCRIPLVADIHFKPDAALEAARWVDKVLINPGNFADSKKFDVREYTDSEYDAEIGRIRDRFLPLVQLCKERGVSMRIGTNHGSLCDRIMNRYGDTPLGMVESALEFAHIARELDYHELVFSMKASNPKVMIEAYRLLVARLEALEEAQAGTAKASSWRYPIHLGVTEAGDSEDGRIKSAIGIGSLLADGIGDTIRVSLTEDSVHEIPVAQTLVALADFWHASNSAPSAPSASLPFDPFSFAKRASEKFSTQGVSVGGGEPVRVVIRREDLARFTPASDGLGPEIIYEEAGILEIDPQDEAAIAAANASSVARLVTIPETCPLGTIPAFRLLASRLDPRHPILLHPGRIPHSMTAADPRSTGVPPVTSTTSDFSSLCPANPSARLLIAASHIGALLCDGIGDAILVRGPEAPRLAHNILQAAGVRIFKTDYVACPSCGRTLFNLQETTACIKAATIHLKGVRIAVMGCIVNGPGEMADADFGYVGGAPGKVNLYVGKTPVKFNVPESEAVALLVDLIREHGRWFDPPE